MIDSYNLIYPVTTSGKDKNRTDARRKTSVVIAMLKCRHHVMSHLSIFGNFLKPYLNYKIGEQEKEYIICYRNYLSLAITICHHLTSLVMPISDFQGGFFSFLSTLSKARDNLDGFFYLALTLIINYYIAI